MIDMKIEYLLGLLYFEAGLGTNVWNLLAHVPVRLSHVSEHTSVRFGLVDAMMRANGCSPRRPLFYSPSMTYIYTCTLCTLLGVGLDLHPHSHSGHPVSLLRKVYEAVVEIQLLKFVFSHWAELGVSSVRTSLRPTYKPALNSSRRSLFLKYI